MNDELRDLIVRLTAALAEHTEPDPSPLTRARLANLERLMRELGDELRRLRQDYKP